MGSQYRSSPPATRNAQSEFWRIPLRVVGTAGHAAFLCSLYCPLFKFFGSGRPTGLCMVSPVKGTNRAVEFPEFRPYLLICDKFVLRAHRTRLRLAAKRSFYPPSSSHPDSNAPTELTLRARHHSILHPPYSILSLHCPFPQS